MGLMKRPVRKDEQKRLTAEEMSLRKLFRGSLVRPLKILRERQRIIEKEANRLLELTKREFEREKTLLEQANDNAGPLVAINMLVVEALFLLQKRTAVCKPTHFKTIHQALTIAERLTMLDMGIPMRGVIYGPDDEAILAAIDRLAENRLTVSTDQA